MNRCSRNFCKFNHSLTSFKWRKRSEICTQGFSMTCFSSPEFWKSMIQLLSCCDFSKVETHVNAIINVSWFKSIDYQLLNYIHARLISLFSYVICIFADDFESLKNVARHLIAWIKIESASTLASRVRPRIIIAVSNDKDAVTYSFL